MRALLQRSNELTRRNFARQLASGYLGVGVLPRFGLNGFAAESPVPTAKRVVYLYMTGGMSHLDTLDVKPGAETQGPTGAIRAAGADYRLSEHLPNLATQGKHLSLVNSISSRAGAHEQGNYLMHTSYEPRGTIRHPAMGAWMLKFHGRANTTLPGNIVVNSGNRHPGAGFLESRYRPINIGDPAKGLEFTESPMTSQDFAERLSLTSRLEADFLERYPRTDSRAALDVYDDAIKLMKSEDLDAFELSLETEAERASYGEDAFGQGCLLARRLLEKDVRYVEVSLNGWDTHADNFERVPELCAILDKGMARLIADLSERGMLDDTLIVLATEFGRTPRINKNEGRDHYPNAFSCAFAGGGIAGGRQWGKTDGTGAEVVEGKVSPADINATMAYALGIPWDEEVVTPSARPIRPANQGKPIIELFG